MNLEEWLIAALAGASTASGMWFGSWLMNQLFGTPAEADWAVVAVAAMLGCSGGLRWR